MKALTDTDQRLMLTDITDDEAQAATRVLSEGARDRAEFMRFLSMVQPAPYTVEASPSVRRAAPRHGISA